MIHPVVGIITAFLGALTAVLGVLLVTVKRWRWAIRRPFAFLAPLAFLMTFLSRKLGESEAKIELTQGLSREILRVHMMWSDLTMLALVLVLLLGWFSVFTLTAESPRESGFGANEGREISATGFISLVFTLACLTVIMTVYATVMTPF